MNGDAKIPEHILYPLYWDLEKLNVKLTKRGSREIREPIEKILAVNGWSNRIRVVPDYTISISSMCDEVGLCLQFGNMARLYADLLKLQLMYLNGTIKSAIYILPMKKFALELGVNVVNYERLTHELQIFQKIIKVPMVVIGIQG